MSLFIYLRRVRLRTGVGGSELRPMRGARSSAGVEYATSQDSQNSGGLAASALTASLKAFFCARCVGVALMLSAIWRSIPCSVSRMSRILAAAILRAKSTSSVSIARLSSAALRSSGPGPWCRGPSHPCIGMVQLWSPDLRGSIDRRYYQNAS